MSVNRSILKKKEKGLATYSVIPLRRGGEYVLSLRFPPPHIHTGLCTEQLRYQERLINYKVHNIHLQYIKCVKMHLHFILNIEG